MVRAARVASTCLLLAAGACSATASAGSAVPVRDLDAPARIVVTERWRDGGRLIVVDETGDRLAPLLVPGVTAGGAAAVDEHPAFSPDGRWIVLASTRERRDGRTSLWVAAARPDAVPVRLTAADAADVDPTWSAAGDAIVFASDRGASFDLYRLPLLPGLRPGDPPRAAGLERLTDAATDELAPSLAGSRLVMQVIDPGARHSWIAERAADGTLVALTDGPSDGAPALAHDGTTLAFTSARLRRDGTRDLDVVVLDGRGRQRAGVALPGSDEGAPAWSVDGRWLFVTSIVRDPDGAPLLPSVLHLDTRARPARLRMLRDVAGTAPRLGPALGPAALDPVTLARSLDHAMALRLALDELAEAAAAAREREGRRRVHSGP
jgi:hypothetical protein